MFFFSSRRRHTRCSRDWSSDVCSSDLQAHHEFDDAVRRILRVKFMMSLFEKPCGDESLLSEVGSEAHRALARSEERRVGKECRCRGSRQSQTKKQRVTSIVAV